MKTKKYSKGFTLVELLLVIAIIAILATVLFVSLGSQRERARVSAFKENARGLVTTFTACADGGGTIGATNSLADISSGVLACSAGNKAGITANEPDVPSCDGTNTKAQISSTSASGDSWNFYAKCNRSGSKYCGMYCSADGCKVDAKNDNTVDAGSSCE